MSVFDAGNVDAGCKCLMSFGRTVADTVALSRHRWILIIEHSDGRQLLHVRFYPISDRLKSRPLCYEGNLDEAYALLRFYDELQSVHF